MRPPRIEQDRANRVSIKLDFDCRHSDLIKLVLRLRGIGAVSPRRKIALETVLANLWVAVRTENPVGQRCGVVVGKSRQSYHEDHWRHFRFDDLMWAVDRAIGLGMAEEIKGVWTPMVRRKTRLLPSLSFTRALHDQGLYDSHVGFVPRSRLVEYRGQYRPSTSEINARQSNLDLINKVNEWAQWSIAKSFSPLSPSHYFTENHPDIIEHYFLTSQDIVMMRVFGGVNFLTGGRFSQKVQSYRKGDRKFLFSNFLNTFEADYESLYPSILYHSIGLELPKNTYEIEELGHVSRKVCKRALMFLISCRDRKHALRTLTFYINSGKLLTEHSPKSIITGIGNKHSKISQFFGADCIGRLQFIESEIAEDVMLTFAKQGWPILGIHDSFRAQTVNRVALIKAMRASYKKIMRKYYPLYKGTAPRISEKST